MRINSCTHCGDSFESKRPDAPFCSIRCRVRNSRKAKPSYLPKESPEKDYTAENIQVRKDLEFDFELIELWAKEYSRPVEWVRRSVESYRLAGAPLEHFQQRYLKKDKSIPTIPEVLEISRQIQIDTP